MHKEMISSIEIPKKIGLATEIGKTKVTKVTIIPPREAIFFKKNLKLISILFFII